MSRTRELAAGGRAVEVEPERLAGFLDRFAAGHGGAVATTVTPQQVDVTAVDGRTARPAGAPHGARTIELLLVRLDSEYTVGVARAGVMLTSRAFR
ncbi:MAG: hypothetical protein ACRDSZ_06185 [Pseudonocardiaceae bacterium]